MNLFRHRIVFFGGKGGVGKTTCAAAYALLASRTHKKTLIVSTDLAHSLSDIFQKATGHLERKLLPNLYGLEIDPDYETKTYLENLKIRVSQQLSADSMKSFEKQLDLALTSPGTQEAALLDKMTKLIVGLDPSFDLLIFDTAPTGQTIRLLTLPDLMGDWFTSLTKRRQKVNSLWKMFTRASGTESGEDPVLLLLEKRRERFSKAKQILIDPSLTAFYMVLIPERLSILETQKTIPILRQYQIPIQGLIVNRVLPDPPDSPFLQRRKEQENLHLKDIENGLGSFKRIQLQQKDRDIVDLDSLREIANDLERLLPIIGSP